MDELSLLRNLDPDTPGPSPAETAAAWARLHAAIDAAQPGASRSTASVSSLTFLKRLARPRFWAPVTAAAAVTAVAITAAMIAPAGPRTSRPGPATGPLSAASVLREAAAAAAAVGQPPGQPPGHGRYFALETESISTDSPRHPYIQAYWMSNGVRGWPAVLPALAGISLTWEQLQHLPTAPDRLLAAIGRQPLGWGNQPLAENEFATIVGLLEGAPASPALRSALYRAAALFPGMRLILHTRDLIGRTASEVFLPGKNISFMRALFFDPATGAVLGDAFIYPNYARCPSPDQEYAVLSSGYVGALRHLPPGSPLKPVPVVLPTAIPNCPPLPGAQPTPTGGQPGTVDGAPTPSPTATPMPTPTAAPTPDPSPPTGIATPIPSPAHTTSR